MKLDEIKFLYIKTTRRIGNCDQGIDHLLHELKEGNREFVRNPDYAEQRRITYESQSPGVIFVSCSDSRTSVPIIVNSSDIGEFFEVKVAGCVVNESDIESIKYAINKIKPRPCLLIVLGHTNCAAVSTTVDTVLHPEAYHYRREYPVLTSGIAPSVLTVIRRCPKLSEQRILHESIVQNTLDRAADLRFLFGREIQVIPALYHLLSGKIIWL